MPTRFATNNLVALRALCTQEKVSYNSSGCEAKDDKLTSKFPSD